MLPKYQSFKPFDIQTSVLNSFWLMNFLIREQKKKKNCWKKNVWGAARKQWLIEERIFNMLKRLQFWIANTSPSRILVEWISLSISVAVCSCIMLKGGQKIKRHLDDYVCRGTIMRVCHHCFHSGQSYKTTSDSRIVLTQLQEFYSENNTEIYQFHADLNF